MKLSNLLFWRRKKKEQQNIVPITTETPVSVTDKNRITTDHSKYQPPAPTHKVPQDEIDEPELPVEENDIPNDAKDLSKQQLKVNPKALELLEKGHALRTQGSFHKEASLEFFIQATEIDPHYALAWTFRGQVLKYLRRNDEALTCLSKSVNLDETDPDSWLSKAETEEALKMYDQAIHSLNKFLTLDLSYFETWEIDDVKNKIPELEEKLSKLKHRTVGESNKPVESLSLTCELCGNVYKIGKDASVTTMEDVQGAAAMTIVITDGRPKTRTDLVMHFKPSWDHEWLEEKKQEGPGKIKFLRESIASGQKRFWYCSSCDNEKLPFPYPPF